MPVENGPVNTPVETGSRDTGPMETPGSSSGVRSKDPLPPPVEIGPVNSQRPWKRQRLAVKKECPTEEDPLFVCAWTEDILAEEAAWT